MHTWGDASRGGFRGGRGGGLGGAEFGPGRRVWRNGGGPGYPADTTSSAARLSTSTSSDSSGVTHSTLWGVQAQSGTVARGGHWGRARGRGAAPRGRGGSSQGSDQHDASSDTNVHTYASSTHSHDSAQYSPAHGVDEAPRGNAAWGARGNRGGHSGRGGYVERGVSRGRGGYDGRGRGVFEDRGRGVYGDRGRGGYEGRGRGGKTGRGRGGFHEEEQGRTRWENSATSDAADPWSGFPYSGSVATSEVTDLWGGAAAQDSNDGQSVRGSFRGRGGGRGRGRGAADAPRGGNEQYGRGGRGGRGSWTPRGGRGGRGGFQGQGGQLEPSPPGPEVNLPPPRDVMGNLLVPALAQLVVPNEVSLEDPIAIKDFKCIASYTWSKDKNPKIIVPGAPRLWLDRPLPIRVPFDKGIRIFHEDALRVGDESTLLPLFRAVDALAADVVPEGAVNESVIDWTTVDFVTDRNNLRKLMRWVRESCPIPSPTPTPSGADTPFSVTDSESKATTSSDSADWDQRKEFRIDMQLGGTSTVLMHRWAAQAREWVEPPKAGCRSNFERESTAPGPGCADGEGHYRIVQYNIGGLNLVVRFEVDAFEDPDAALVTGDIESPVSAKDTSPWGDTPALTSASEWRPTNAAEDQGQAGQKITETANVDLWGGPISSASDWGVSEPSPASDMPTRHGSDHRKSSTRSAAQVVSPADVWGGSTGDPSSWGVEAEAASISAATPKKDGAISGAWEIKSDASAWGAETAGNDVAAWSMGVADNASTWEVQDDPSTKRGAKSDAPSLGPSTAVGVDTTASFSPVADFKVIRAGTLLPQARIVELATRSMAYLDRTTSTDTFLQMFLTQTPIHLIAVHQRGTFERVIRQELVSEEFVRIAEAEDIRRGLAQFVELLQQIQQLVKEHGKEGRVSLVCEKGKLEMFGLVGQEGFVRPEELARFERA